jgi:hypothetical protein
MTEMKPLAMNETYTVDPGDDAEFMFFGDGSVSIRDSDHNSVELSYEQLKLLAHTFDEIRTDNDEKLPHEYNQMKERAEKAGQKLAELEAREATRQQLIAKFKAQS